jgi:hypothetical protein
MLTAYYRPISGSPTNSHTLFFIMSCFLDTLANKDELRIDDSLYYM